MKSHSRQDLKISEKNHKNMISSEPTTFNDGDLLNDAVRLKYVNSHPLFTEHIINTTTISEFCDLVRKVVLVREQGCCFTARSGAGKTMALRALKNYLRENFPEIVVYEHDTQNRQVPSVRAFFQHFLDSLHCFDDKGETYQLRKRLRNRFVDDARQAGMKLVLLLVDEAQAMDTEDFKFLKDIDNAVRKEDVQLITILMGQEPQFSARHGVLIANRHLDLVGRFLMRMLTFPSMGSLEDIQTILGELDRLVYPAESGWTWTQFFFPRAWAAGFRMKNEAANFLKALINVSSEKQSLYEFPARQTFLALRSFVIDNSGYDNANMSLPASAWDDAVSYAQLQLALNLSSPQENRDGGGKVKI